MMKWYEFEYDNNSIYNMKETTSYLYKISDSLEFKTWLWYLESTIIRPGKVKANWRNAD